MQLAPRTDSYLLSCRLNFAPLFVFLFSLSLSMYISYCPFPLPPSATIRDLFRTSGGLSYVMKLLFTSSSPLIQQASLYTLGCASEKNGLYLLCYAHEPTYVCNCCNV